MAILGINFLGKKTDQTPKPLVPTWGVAVITLIVALGLVAGAAVWYQWVYSQRIYPGVVVGDVQIGGMGVDQARSLLNQKVDSISATGFTFVADTHTATVNPTIVTSEALDVVFELVRFDVDGVVTQAQAVGRSGNVLYNFVDIVRSRWGARQVAMPVVVDTQKMQEVLQREFSDHEQPGADADISVVIASGTAPLLQVLPERAGRSFRYVDAISQLQRQLAVLQTTPVRLVLGDDVPHVLAADVQAVLPQAQSLVASVTPTLVFDEQQWPTTPVQVASWLTVRADSSGHKNVSLRSDPVREWLQSIASTIDVAPTDARFTIENEKVKEFTPSVNGVALNIASTTDSFHTALAAHATSVPAVVSLTESSVRTDDVNQLGIKEVIGVGRSNFRGSPVNRRHNIRTGAAALNGLLIAPGQEFSLIKALGAIDATSGYRQELVIKGNKTTPEYGGGLCQIGTTLFRAVLGSGLPVLERRNHSYNVTYYLEDGLPGVDATIYDPKPDMRFTNDTAHHVLIQTKVEGDDLLFEFWGTKDGRVAERTKPEVWGWTTPAPTKLIKTTDLPVGQKKCTEVSHAGVNAKFTYTVTYPSGEIKKEDFESHYRPWQAVCLIGATAEEVSAESAPPAAPATEAEPEAVIN